MEPTYDRNDGMQKKSINKTNRRRKISRNNKLHIKKCR